jgi:hypothetical protein
VRAARTSRLNEEKYFLWFSDIHFDPYYATAQAYSADGICNITDLPSVGKHGCDSSAALVRSAIHTARMLNIDEPSQPSFIIVTGDSGEFLSYAYIIMPLTVKSLFYHNSLMHCLLSNSAAWDRQYIHKSY